MSDTAAHLMDRVLPEAPVRQWVLSLPIPLRYRVAYADRSHSHPFLVACDQAMMFQLQRGEPVVYLDGNDARVRGLGDHDWVRVWTRIGPLQGIDITSHTQTCRL